MRKPLLIALAFTLLTLPAFASHYSDFYVIPVGSHTPGAAGTMWMSDIAIHNFQSTPLSVELVFIESGVETGNNVFPLVTGTVNGSTTIPAGGSVLLQDVLNGYRGMSSITGAFLVGADRPFAVTSRNYSMSPAGDTIGQTVTPSGSFLDNTLYPTDLGTAVAYIPGLINNARFRTNLGFVAGNANATPMNVTITMRDGNGASIGSGRSFTIAAGTFMHLQFSSRAVADRTFDVAAAEFRITGGSGAVVPYASVIDNNTADAVFVLGEFPVSRNPSGMSKNTLSGSIFREVFERTKVRQ